MLRSVMRKLLLPLLATLPALGLGLAGACGSNNAAPPPSSDDASPEASDDGADAFESTPGPDAAQMNCTLADTTDPVALCIPQKIILRSIVEDKIYVKGQGLPASWDSTTGLGNNDHSWQADLGFASSIASYHCSSEVYGDNEVTPELDALLPDVAGVLEAELPTAPPGYDGEVYFRLRNAAAGLFYVNDNADAQKLAQLAESYGQAIEATYAQSVAAGDGGASSIVLGTPAGGGAVAYAPAQVVMGAAALLDMAARHALDADAGTNPATWEATALGALDYVWNRARDPVTGLFYQSLVTSGDPMHDALGAGVPTNDALLTDVQGPIVLGLARVQDLVTTLQNAGDAGMDAETLPANVYWNEANTIVTAMNAAGLWDGATPPNPGAFFEGLLPAANAVLTDKPVLGNAMLLGGFHRVSVGIGSTLAPLLGSIKQALMQQQPDNSSLFSVVAGGAGQDSFLRASSSDWHFALAFGVDGGAGGQEPGATQYRAEAVADAIEGLTQIWHGRSNPPQCGN